MAKTKDKLTRTSGYMESLMEKHENVSSDSVKKQDINADHENVLQTPIVLEEELSKAEGQDIKTPPMTDVVTGVSIDALKSVPEEVSLKEVAKSTPSNSDALTPLITLDIKPSNKKASSKKEEPATQQVQVADKGTGQPEEKHEIFVAQDILAIPKIQGDIKRINYPVKVEMVETIKELAKQSRMSSSVIVERVLEKYLVKDGLKSIIPTLPERYRAVRFNEGQGFKERDTSQLQIAIPIFYIDKISDTMKELNEAYSLDMKRGHLVDILLSDSIKVGDSY